MMPTDFEEREENDAAKDVSIIIARRKEERRAKFKRVVGGKFYGKSVFTVGIQNSQLYFRGK